MSIHSFRGWGVLGSRGINFLQLIGLHLCFDIEGSGGLLLVYLSLVNHWQTDAFILGNVLILITLSLLFQLLIGVTDIVLFYLIVSLFINLMQCS